MQLSRATGATASFAARATRLSPFVHARFAPSIRTDAFARGPAVLAFHHAQLRLLTTSHPFLAAQPSTPPPSAAAEKAVADAPKDVAVQDEKKAAVAKKDSFKDKGTRMQRVWAVVKKEALHYWHGTKLLGKEVRISARLLRRLVAGKKLTRREHRQVRPPSPPVPSFLAPAAASLSRRATVIGQD